MVVDVQFACSDTGIPAETDIQDWVEFAASQSGRLPDGDADIAVRVVDAAEIQTLNKRYREKDMPTNVLSFPAGQIDGLPSDAVRQLGDIVVCAPVVSEEAAPTTRTAMSASLSGRNGHSGLGRVCGQSIRPSAGRRCRHRRARR